MLCGAFSLLGFFPVCETHSHTCFKLHLQKVKSSAASLGSNSSVYSGPEASISLLLSGGRTPGPVGLSWHLSTLTDGKPGNKLEASWTAPSRPPGTHLHTMMSEAPAAFLCERWEWESCPCLSTGSAGYRKEGSRRGNLVLNLLRKSSS